MPQCTKTGPDVYIMFLKDIVKRDNVLSVHTILDCFIFFLLRWIGTTKMLLRLECVCVSVRVCNQRIIAHSFQSLGRHKFSGSSLLYALPKKATKVVAHTHTRARITIPVYAYIHIMLY